MGMTSKKIPIAMLKTFWYVKILPWFAISFVSGFLFMFTITGIGVGSIWLFPVILQGLFIAANLVLIAVARRRAQDAFSKWSNLATAG
jgi:hypothetical protein